MKILVVEDDNDIRQVLVLMVAQAGHEVIEAVDGESAVRKFIDCDCSIVLLDWMLPGLSGIEVAKRIQEVRYAYIVMVTGKEREKSAEEAVEAGVRDYIQKPFDAEELMESIEVAEAIVHARELLSKRFERLGVDVEIVNRYL